MRISSEDIGNVESRLIHDNIEELEEKLTCLVSGLSGRAFGDWEEAKLYFLCPVHDFAVRVHSGIGNRSLDRVFVTEA